MLVMAAFALPALSPGPDADLFWHLRAGDDLLSGAAGAFRESWSYTAAGQAWINHEWLAELAFAAARRAGGEAGLLLFTALIASLTAFLLWRSADHAERPAWLHAFLLCLAAAAISDRFVPRPQLLTYLCIALLMERLSAIRAGAAPWTLLPLQVFWTNVHGPLWGLFLAIPLLIGGAVPALAWRRRLALCAGLLAASCVHPQGFRVITDYVEVFGGQGLYRQTIREWLPLTDPKQEPIPQTGAVWLLLAMASTLFVTGLLSRATWRRWGVLFCLAAVIAAPFGAIRNRDLLAMTLVPLAAMLWTEFPAGVRRRTRPLALPAALGAVALAAIPALGFALPGAGRIASVPYPAALPPRLALSTRTFPVAAVRFLTSEPVGTRIFNAYDYGGFLVDRLRDRRVFIDGRYFVYGESLYLDYLTTRDGGPEAIAVLDRTGTDALLIRYPEPDGYQGLADLVLRSREWALVFWDDESLVFLRKSGIPEAWMAAHEYRWLFPTLPEWTREPGYWTRNFSELATEARHAISEAPEALLPRVLLGLVFEYNARTDEAAAAYRGALALEPGHLPALEGLRRIGVLPGNGKPADAARP